jgi:nitroreductase
MRALSQRKSSRSFSGKALTHQEISNLLWAAFGINRPDKGRTAPSDMNMQETLIFLAMADGLFVYDARANAVLQISAADIRKDTAYQHFAAAAPLDLIFAADLNAMKVIKKEEEKESAAAVDAALVGENVYLYCASAGLNTVLLGWFDKKKLREIMGLDDSFILTFTQPVGYPPDKKGE